MAKTAITPVVLERTDVFGTVEFTAATTPADGFLVDFTEDDHKTVLVFQNTATAEATVTIKAGNGIQGVADIVATIPASAVQAVVVESGAHKFVTGENKGKLAVIPSAATLKLGVVVLP